MPVHLGVELADGRHVYCDYRVAVAPAIHRIQDAQQDHKPPAVEDVIEVTEFFADSPESICELPLNSCEHPPADVPIQWWKKPTKARTVW